MSESVKRGNSKSNAESRRSSATRGDNSPSKNLLKTFPHQTQTVAEIEGDAIDASNLLQHINAVGVQDPHLLSVQERDFFEDEVPQKVLDFSEYSHPEKIREICHQKVPGWSIAPLEHVQIKQVTEGLTNQIFKIYLEPVLESVDQVVLFRIYGTQSKEFIDPDVEIFTFEMLSKYQIAPRLIHRDVGFRIEEWHFALAVPVRLLPNPSIFCQVACHLGRFHKLHLRADFPSEEQLSRTPSCLEWLEKWAASAAKVSMHSQEWIWRLQNMVDEAKWLREYIQSNMQRSIVTGQGWDVVFCHNDCQENNLLQTQYGLRLIDFEYAHFNFQAYDIANFFNEFVSDYIVNAHPFFQLDFTRYPNLDEQRLFCAVYLSEYLRTPVRPTDRIMVDPLVDAIEIFSLVSNMCWGLWSVLRSPQALTYDEFDFMAHGAYRFDAYMRGKRAHVAKRRGATDGDHSRPQMRKSISAVSQMQLEDMRGIGSQVEEVTQGEGSARPTLQLPIARGPISALRNQQIADELTLYRVMHKKDNEWKWLCAGAVAGFVIAAELFRFLRK